MRPIAIIGYAARLPGAPSADEAWGVMAGGRSAVTEIPEDRWASMHFLAPGRIEAGRSLTRAAGVLDTAFDFDANYFGIAPAEAEQMDPQQRLLLELAAEAMAHAGLDPDRLDRDRAGVFVGASGVDHSVVGQHDPGVVGAQFMLGNTLSILANRISYTWDLRGPSLTVDTACSSSLVALDQARRALAAREIDTAIVGGVNLLLSPVPFVGFSHATMLSPNGRCAAFGKGADGYVRAEGAVVFVLQAEEVARAAGARIRSRLVGTGVNTAGRTTAITIPSEAQQARLISEVCDRFGLDPARMAYVEAHGTGTPVGDPREARAIGAVYGAGRARPLPIGSAKTNFGHLEPASGLVGLLKAQFVLEKGLIPASLHAEEPNPEIDFEALNLTLARDARPLDLTGPGALAAVNSFGFGGANAHAVLASVEPEPMLAEVVLAEVGAAPPALPPALMLSAQSPAALDALVARWQALVAARPADLALQIANANHNRARLRHRLCLGAGTIATLEAEIAAWRAGEHLQAAPPRSPRRALPVAFVFSGNGAIWSGMARANHAGDPAFRDSFDATAALVAAAGGPALLPLLLDDQPEAALRPAGIAQPLHLAVQLAIVDALAAAGLRPAACLGHSLGEVAANVAAGRLSRADAVRVVLARAKSFQPLFETGGMAALATGRAEAEALIAAAGLPLDIAAENSPASVTVSGPGPALTALVRAARAARIAGKVLAVAYPYHGRAVDTLEREMRAALAGIGGRTGTGGMGTGTAFYAGFSGRRADDIAPDGDYWWRNARRPVAFRQGIEALARDGFRMIVEISPRAVLRGYVAETLETAGAGAVVLDTLDPARAALRQAPALARRALAAGAALDETRVLGPARPYRSAPPAAAFERKTLRLEAARGPDLFGRRPQHPLLGGRVAPDLPAWRGSVSVARLPWLADHRVGGRVILPAAAMLEMLAAAAEEEFGAFGWELRDVEILRAVELPEAAEIPLRTTWEPSARRMVIEQGGAAGWLPVAVARVFAAVPAAPLPAAPEAVDWAETGSLYAGLAGAGLAYGPAFARAEALGWAGAELRLRLGGAGLDGMLIDPTALDAVMHGLAAFAPLRRAPGAGPLVPGRVGRLRRLAPGRVAGGVLSLRHAGDEGAEADLRLLDDAGREVARIEGLRLRAMPLPRPRETLFWTETLVPVAGTGRVPLPALATALARAPGAPPSDADVLRGAIAGRLAWDLVMSGRTDDRLAPALDWLVGQGVLDFHADPQADEADCPWPALDPLIAALSEAPEDVQAELQAVLAADCGRPPPREPPAARARRALAGALAAEAGAIRGHVAVLGAVDGALLAALAGPGRIVTRIGLDPEALAAERLHYDRPGLRFAALDDPGPGERFDLVVGANVAETLPAADWHRVPGLVAPGGAVLLIEEEIDLFARLTGRSGTPGALDRLAAILAGAGIAPELAAAAAGEHLRLLTARAATPEPALPALAVQGTGALAAALRACCTAPADEGGPAVLALDRVEPAALRDLPPGQPLWLVAAAETLPGWRRVLANETGRDLRCATVAPGADLGLLAVQLATSDEHELVAGPEGIAGPRLLPCDPRAVPPGPDDRVILHSPRRSATLEDLGWVAAPRRAPGPGEVEIAVEATALNFRDLMWGQGLVPPEAIEAGFAGQGFGMECAGRILRAGPGAGFAPGEPVIAFAPQAFASHVTVAASAVMALPPGITPEIAASVPVIYLTADYALGELARLQPDETVLIHGAASGVGLAAVQVAQAIGARIIATAGSPEKRRFLQALGLEAVLDSRSADFGDRARALTGGRGVDVVLNAQAGEAMERGIAALAPFGRFVELGKRDIYANNLIALRALRDNVSLMAVDVDQLVAHRPGVAARVMARVAAGLAEGRLRLPPVRIFAAAEVAEAFGLMQRSGHLGKIVLRAPDPHLVPRREAGVPDLSGRWLITGGTGGFGLATARWLAWQGATELWLASRSGSIPPEDRAAIEAIGARVEPVAVDVTNERAMAALIDRIGQGGPLAGVVHAAAVLDDGLFQQAADATLAAVLAPKVDGARLLDRLTRPLGPRHFWLYSSVSARFGNPGQAAYVAASHALEALAAARRAEGLCGLAIAWGPVADAGMVARDPALGAVLARQLGRLLTADEALAALGEVIGAGAPPPVVTIAPVDWARLARDLPVIRGPLFAAVDLSGGRTDAAFDLSELVARRGIAVARREVTEILVAEVARIMRAAPSEIDPARPFVDMGFDSLMAMNLKMAAEERLGREVPLRGLTEDLGIGALVQQLFDALDRGGAASAAEELAERHLTGETVSHETRARIVAQVDRRTGT
ncbi:SDR family NAD(P)-dependent oxidoreductase [Frigidibacter sp. MR17.24]|uniref:SDR family NAD(P)-dependent oxidoreductase n=1 Tax=Frigidibacter sp. MR17.24 TaxID=3127345 RepID=UPI003012D486